ncbi:Dynamin [Drechslerella dactyloides]|uniref:Dynamin n=1 Tax=Drechslerella dactyloides TaxID=74499 RepID=A0AAD6IZL0_DREDA|nr:Dynamin [Drechslerella dactyloides]
MLISYIIYRSHTLLLTLNNKMYTWGRSSLTSAMSTPIPRLVEENNERELATASQLQTFSSLEDLESEERSELFDLIDKFRELNISEDVSLPQLVVVGDQSSGKSSLLEGLTEVSFPVASDLCTRFATQIVLRRVDSDENYVKATIIPGPEAERDEVLSEHLRDFEISVAEEEFSPEWFATILDDASERMGLPGPSERIEGTPEKRFSNDILKIELSGRQRPNLTIVDVPGLFHSRAVMNGQNNLANQEVFRMARNVDPDGKRTVGVITKCDQVQPGDERGVIQIAMNEVERLHHGWFVVKNRSTRDIRDGVTIAQRHAKEREFFSRAPWSCLPRERIGIDKLKPFLAHILLEHVRAEFPRLINEINRLVVDTENALQRLGETRLTPTEQRMFLTRIANEYDRLVTDCLDGRLREAVDTQSPLKIRTLIQNLNQEFGFTMKITGHTHQFKGVNDNEGTAFLRPADAADSHTDIYTWIRNIYHNSRGPELPGLVNPNILIEAFREQSTGWSTISRRHVSKVVGIVTKFNTEILNRVIADENVRRKLVTNLTRATTDAVNKAYQQLDQLIEAERSGILLTVNDEFTKTLAEAKEQRVLGRLKKVQAQLQPANSAVGAQAVNALDNLMRAVVLSNEDTAVYDIHDSLKCYYSISLKRFTDNVIIQVIEDNLLGREGPIRLLKTDYIAGLDETDLANITREDWQVASTRRELTLRLERARSAQEAASMVSM